MKKLVALSLFGLLTVACKTTSQSDVKDIQGVQSPTQAELAVVTLDGKIEGVTKKDGAEPTTEVAISYPVSCYQKEEQFRYDYEMTRDGKVTIYAFKLVSHPAPGPHAVLCQGFGYKTHTVTVLGHYSMNDLTLVNLKVPNTPVPEETGAMPVIQHIVVDSVRPLCPRNMVCITDGTVIKLKATIGCLDKLGPVAYHAKEEGGRLSLRVSVINFANPESRLAFCDPPYGVHEIQLPNVFVDRDKIDLRFLNRKAD